MKCPAKINMYLNIVEKDDKFHKMHMINQAVSIFDILTIKKIDKGIILKSNSESLPLDETNSVYKACDEFLNYTKIDTGVEVYIEKHIPMESGLGGESTDAAGVLVGLNTLLDTNLDEEELLSLGLKVGCDVPFCIKSSTQEVEGYGEVLKEYECNYSNFLVVTPPFGLSTKEMFSKYDSLDDYSTIPITIGHNDFHKVITKDIKELIELVSNTDSKYSFLTGSGSSVVGIYNNKEDLKKAFDLIKNKLNDSYKVFMANSVSKIEINIGE